LEQEEHNTSVVIPHVESLSEALARVYKRYGISAAVRLHTNKKSIDSLEGQK